MTTWYNEIDPFAARWLRELMRAGQIAAGVVDERPIETLGPADIAGGRAHFFAGIGGWDLALRLAGWPDDRPVWTGSCPCQPFSVAGKGAGGDDPRHLWPAWFRLIRECRPGVIFGEQVPGAIGHGWLDGVFGDLEAEGYACGAVVLGAHSVGAPHIRQRLFWVADTNEGRLGERAVTTERERETFGRGFAAPGDGASGRVADASGNRTRDDEPKPEWWPTTGPITYGSNDGLEHAPCKRFDRRCDTAGTRGRRGAQDDGGMGGTDAAGSQGRDGAELRERPGQCATWSPGAWDDSYWLPCTDGRARRVPVEPALQPLAHGLPGRVGMLRGAGNSIVPQVAVTFVKAYMEACDAREGDDDGM